jgi:hypothetical protein
MKGVGFKRLLTVSGTWSIVYVLCLQENGVLAGLLWMALLDALLSSISSPVCVHQRLTGRCGPVSAGVIYEP